MMTSIVLTRIDQDRKMQRYCRLDVQPSLLRQCFCVRKWGSVEGPSWENHISAFPENVPQEFAAEFRAVRNKANGHVTHERANKSLTDFYDKYHQFMHMTDWNCLGFWGGHRNDVFPDLQEITDFSIMIRKATLSGATAPATEEAARQRSAAILEEIGHLS